MTIAEFEFEFIDLAGGFVFHSDCTCFHLVYEVVKYEHIVQGEVVVVSRIFEGEWQDGVVDEVGLVDTCKALCDNCLYTQVEWCEGSVFAAGALAVVVACHNHRCRVGHCLATCWELGIGWGQAVVGEVRHVGTVWQEFCVGWHDVVGGDVVFEVSSHLTGEGFRHRLTNRYTLDIWTLDEFGVTNLVFAREDEEVVVSVVDVRYLYVCKAFFAGWAGEDAIDGRERGGFRAYEVNVCTLGTAATEEVTVEGTEADAVGVRCLTHADARTATAFQNAGAGFEEDGEGAIGCHLLQDGAGPWGDNEAHVFSNLLTLEDRGAACQIQVGGVGAATDGHLVDLHAGKAFNGHNLVWAVWASSHWFEGTKIYVDGLKVLSIVVCSEWEPLVTAAHGIHVNLGVVITREDGAGSTQFSAHVGDGSTFWHAQRCNAVAGVFIYLVHAALYGFLLEHIKDDVLGTHACTELAGEAHFNHIRHGDVVTTPCHCSGNVNTAGTDCEHAQATAGRGVGVGTDEGFARDPEVFEVDLVANPVARTRIGETEVFSGTLDEQVVVKVFRTALQHVVVDVRHRAFGFYTVDAHCFQFEIRHGPGGVLGQSLVNTNTDFIACFHFTVGDMRSNDFFCQCRHENPPC